ncbi:serine/threonine-protein kinase [Streptomyces gobitricini]|uniref:Protein kinase domain-containing protein n=1 Tax=Streptomyces gobitricini TaxID=68211 RepID=A0ABN3M7A0_9ACTN
MIDSNGHMIVAERYVLTERLGSGGMGTVWSAWDHLLQRAVAVKELHIVSHGEELRARMRRVLTEARAIARVSHPHVIDIYDLVEYDDRLWIVMELVSGGSLADHLKAGGPLPATEVARLGLQLLSALDAVHATGALHRDVKPANVLLRADGSAVLTDFGIAALADEAHTATGGVVGSVEFMAPERMRGLPADPSSDLFSLGATLCSLATGTPPFVRPEPTAVMHAVVYEPPEIAPSAGALRGIIEELLHKEPTRRPTPAMITHALQAVIAQEDRPLQPTRRHDPITARRRRVRVRPWKVAVLAGALLVGGAGAGLYWWADSSRAPIVGTETKATPQQIDAVMAVPGAEGRFWVFSGGRYVVVEAGESPAAARRVSGPGSLADWKKSFGGLPAFTSRIDAAMPVPGYDDRYWVFSGSQYIEIEVAAGSSARGRLQQPSPLTDWATSFSGLPGFDERVDAVMAVPGAEGRFWVFSGGRYVVVEAGESPAAARRVSGPGSLADWKKSFGGLPAFTSRIDAAMPVPGHDDRYWVFSGSQYIEIEVAAGSSARGRLQQPSPLTDWQPLRILLRTDKTQR